MSWRDRLRTLFVSDNMAEDPDEPVEIGVVPLASGPLAIAYLEEAGFDAGGHDAFNIVSSVSSGYRIMVPYSQSEAAALRLDEILTT